jgi:hypothetical protein
MFFLASTLAVHRELRRLPSVLSWFPPPFFFFWASCLFISFVISGLQQWCSPLLLAIDAGIRGVLQGVRKKSSKWENYRAGALDIGVIRCGGGVDETK